MIWLCGSNFYFRCNQLLELRYNIQRVVPEGIGRVVESFPRGSL